jgi:chromosome segregation ATPase
MTLLKRLAGWTVLLLGVIVLFALLLSLVGIWVVRSPLTTGLTEASTGLEEELTQIDSYVEQAGTVVGTIRSGVAELTQAVEKVAAQLRKGKPGDESELAKLERKLTEHLHTAEGVANAVKAQANSIERFLALIATLSLKEGQADDGAARLVKRMRDFADGAAAAASLLRQANKGLTDLREHPEVAEKLAREVAERLLQVDDRLGRLQEAIRRGDLRLDEARAAVTRVKERGPDWITLAAVLLTVLLGWFALSQVSMILHGWSLARRSEPGTK